MQEPTCFSPLAAGCQDPAHAGYAGGQSQHYALTARPGEHACRRVHVSEGGVSQRVSSAAHRVVHADRDQAWLMRGGEHGDAIAVADRNQVRAGAGVEPGCGDHRLHVERHLHGS